MIRTATQTLQKLGLSMHEQERIALPDVVPWLSTSPSGLAVHIAT